MMNCKKAVSLIPDYLNDALEPDKLEEFMEHIDSCDDCREELSIQLLITDGLNTLSTGDSFDLQSSMENRVSSSRRQIHIHNRLFMLRNIGVALVGAMVAAVVAVVYFLFLR